MILEIAGFSEIEEESMFQHRELGLNQAYQIAATLVLTVLFWAYFWVLSTFIPHFSLTGVGNYFEYYVALILAFQVSLVNTRQQDIFSVNSGILESHRLVRPHFAFAVAITFMFLVLTKDAAISRVFLLTFIPFSYMGLVLFTRYAALPLLEGLLRTRKQSLLLIGRPGELAKVESLLSKAKKFGMETVGMLTEAPQEELPAGVPKLGEPADLEKVLAGQEIGNVFILGSPRDRRHLGGWLVAAEQHGCRVSLVNDLDVFLQRRLSYFRCDDVDLIELREEPLQNLVNRLAKRLFDVCISLPVVLFALPVLMVVVWFIHRLQAPGPLLFRQIRSGIDNQPFEILKFRTMYADQCDSARQASVADGRIFPAGRWLRRFSLDEFPQFFNVLTGQMSVVGPRPHMRQHDAVFAETMSSYRLRSFVKPGLSGLAQIRGFRGEALAPEDIVHRVECDIEYVETWTFGLDVRIVWQTARQIVRPPKSAY